MVVFFTNCSSCYIIHHAGKTSTLPSPGNIDHPRRHAAVIASVRLDAHVWRRSNPNTHTHTHTHTHTVWPLPVLYRAIFNTTAGANTAINSPPITFRYVHRRVQRSNVVHGPWKQEFAYDSNTKSLSWLNDSSGSPLSTKRYCNGIEQRWSVAFSLNRIYVGPA